MIGSFGNISFVASEEQIRTFSSLSRKYAARYARHDVIGKKPVLEFLGPDLIKIPLNIRLDSSKGVNPAAEITELTEIMNSGSDQALLLGDKYLGQFVILTLNEDDPVIDNRGVVRVANITLELEEYADDRA